MSEDRKVALVTGATRGIGRAIAAELAGAGWFVVGTATSEKGAAVISEALGEQGAQPVPVRRGHRRGCRLRQGPGTAPRRARRNRHTTRRS